MGGVVKDALTFNGNGRINLSSVILNSVNNITMTAWIYNDNVEGSFKGILFDRLTTISGYQLNYFPGGNGQIGYHWNDGFFNWNSGLFAPHSKWSFVAFSVEPTRATVYLGVDGSPLKSASNVAAHGPVNFSGLRIGMDDVGNNSRVFRGRMDDVRFYNRTLSAAELEQIYNARDGIRYNESYRVPEYFDGNRFVAMTPAWPDVRNGLLAHWKFDEVQGLTAFDSSGNSRHLLEQTGTFPFEANSQIGAVGRAYRIAGRTGFGEGPQFLNASVIPTNTAQPFTVSAWIQDQGVNWSQFWAIDQGGTGPFTVHKNTNCLRVSTPTAEHRNALCDPVPGRWYHVVVTYNGADTRIYIDGVYQSGGFGAFNHQAVYSTGNFVVGRFFAGSTKPSGIDDVRVYNRVLSAAERQMLYDMGTPVGSSTALPQGCPNIGDVCDDGTIYAGLSPDGNVPMFARPCDEGQEWNGSSCTGTRAALPWNNGNGVGFVATGQTSTVTGFANTLTLGIVDSNSDAAGFQSHQAAQRCSDLVTNGADDWYLPSRNELQILGNSRDLIGGFDTTCVGVTTTNTLWSVSERTSTTADGRYFCNNNLQEMNKGLIRAVRCVRKGPAPRCANPYGLEGEMFFNTDHDVVQYCDGARWVSIGKAAP